MDIDLMVPKKSNFLTKEDVGEAGKNLTIRGFSQQEIGRDNEKETRYVIEWQQADFKPMVLNKENATRLKMICKTSDTTQMVGKTVNVYSDPFVAFGGEIKGGIRIRPVATTQPQQAPMQRQAAPQRDDGMGPPSPPIEAYSRDGF